jgi:hypothetical protein
MLWNPETRHNVKSFECPFPSRSRATKHIILTYLVSLRCTQTASYRFSMCQFHFLFSPFVLHNFYLCLPGVSISYSWWWRQHGTAESRRRDAVVSHCYLMTPETELKHFKPGYKIMFNTYQQYVFQQWHACALLRRLGWVRLGKVRLG